MKKLKILGIGLGIGYLAGKQLNRRVLPSDYIRLWKWLEPLVLHWPDEATATEALWAIQDYVRKQSYKRWISADELLELIKPDRNSPTTSSKYDLGWWTCRDINRFGIVHKGLFGYYISLPQPQIRYHYSNDWVIDHPSYASYYDSISEEGNDGSIQSETEIPCDSGE